MRKRQEQKKRGRGWEVGGGPKWMGGGNTVSILALFFLFFLSLFYRVTYSLSYFLASSLSVSLFGFPILDSLEALVDGGFL